MNTTRGNDVTENANNDPLGKALGINPLPEDHSLVQVDRMLDEATDDSASADFESARATIIEVMHLSQDLAARAADVADQSQSAKSFEAAANLLKTQLQSARDLLALQRDIRMIKDADRRAVSKPQNVTNQVLICSTSEMLDRLLEKKDDKGN